jgi:alkylmercury lyase-like protein
MGNLVVATAEELKAQSQLERQVARRAAREKPLPRLILRTFLDRGGPIPIEDIVSALPQAAPEATCDALATLEDEDLIRIRAGQIDVAYPFSAAPTPFVVKFPRGRDRYACCATDALGMAPMAGEAVEIASQCHHCGDALTFSVTPRGPGPESDGVMVWFGIRDDDQCKAIDGL